MSTAALLELPINNDLQDELFADAAYQDQQGPAPLPTGNYRLRADKVSIRRNKEGEVILKDGKYPTFVIEMATVVEPQEFAGRKVALYADVSSKPFNRNGSNASRLLDLLRAFDQNRTYRGLAECRDALQEFVDSGATFAVRLDWAANDLDGAKEALADAGISGPYAEMDAEEQQTANAIYKAHKLRGMKRFPQNGNGSYNPNWTSPSGNTVEARSDITRYYPSDENVKFS